VRIDRAGERHVRHDQIDPGAVPVHEPDPFAPSASGTRNCVGDWATGPPLTIRLDALVPTVHQLLRARRLSEVAVVDLDDRFVGVVTERAIASALTATSPALVPSTVSSLVVPWASVSPAGDICDVARFMDERGLTSLPVVDGGRVVGIVTEADVIEELRVIQAATTRGPRWSGRRIQA
jgi:acetoin utilization protein AcuB